MVKNHSTSCRSKMLQCSAQNLLKDIIAMPETDYDYGRLCCEVYKGVLFCTSENRLMGWENNKWVELNKKTSS